MDVPIMIFMRDLDCFDFKWLLYSQTSCLFLFDKRIAFTHTIFTGHRINLYVRTSHAVITKSGMHRVYDVYRPSKYWRESISLQMVVKSYL